MYKSCVLVLVGKDCCISVFLEILTGSGVIFCKHSASIFVTCISYATTDSFFSILLSVLVWLGDCTISLGAQ